ncbi:AraC family transcriptional regulator ligand-binding domain-containing protein, partial [Klebsiella pneumoniae]
MDPANALRHAQIDAAALDDPGARVTAAQMEVMSGHAMQELDDEALGWFSRRLPWGCYGMLCRASLTAPTLEVALKRWCRHHR